MPQSATGTKPASTVASAPRKGKRFHEISVPQVIDEHSVVYYVDCGRAGNQCIDDLLQRLEILHSGIGMNSVVFGQGFLP